MSNFLIALKSLLFHRHINLSIALGVAAATAVLTGALIVGDSMRGSLRDLTLDRLGAIDSMIFSDGFFREQLAEEIQQTAAFKSAFDQASPVIFFPNGTAERSASDNVKKNLGEVNVLGIHNEFWQFSSFESGTVPTLAAGEVIINQVVADDLGVTATAVTDGSARITIGIPKQRLLPADSSLGKKEDLVERIVNLTVVKIVPAKSLGRFGVHPTQIPPRNVYLPIRSMQEALNDGILKFKDSIEQANVILLSGKDGAIATAEQTKALSEELSVPLSDLGFGLKRVTQSFKDENVFDYFSLSADRLVLSDKAADSVRQAYPDANELVTYLANKIGTEQTIAQKNAIPFSMVTALNFDQVKLTSVSGQPIPPLGPNEIAINRWVAEDQNIEVGDAVSISYFEPETTHGDENEKTESFVVAAIVELIEPTVQPQPSRRNPIGAVYETRPSRANDPDMTPAVPGLTDTDSIDDWELPFETPGIRTADDGYWNTFRTTPKAFVSLETGKRLWSSRFGVTTSFQIPADGNSSESVTAKLLSQFRTDGHLPGLQVVPVKANGLKASSGSTPFDALFLSLSMFVIGAALALVSLLFRLALQKRSAELGTLLAVGFEQKQVGRIWLSEMMAVCLAGAVLGIFLGIGYAALMLYGLKTWWVGAITTPFLNMHIRWWTLPLGLTLGTLICAATIWWSLRATRKQPVRALLAGQLQSENSVQKTSFIQRAAPALLGICILAAIALTVLGATSLGGESQAGAFMTSGFLILSAALIWIFRRLKTNGKQVGGQLSLDRLASTNAGRNPLRSTLTIGLVAVASFLIVAISAFRLAPTKEGTAGFNYVVSTSQPVFENLNTPAGQKEVLLDNVGLLADTSQVLSFRYKPGQDASCNNPYQSTQPQVLGVTQATIAHFDDESVDQFSFAMTGGDNPWQLLNEPVTDGIIPVIHRQEHCLV